MSPPSEASSNTEMGSVIYTQCSNSDIGSSTYGVTSGSDPEDISDRLVPWSRKAPSLFLRTFKGKDIDRHWLVSIERSRIHTQLEKVAEAEGKSFPSTSLKSRKPFIFHVRRFPEEVKYIVDYINEGDYPIFYTDSNGFDVLEYFKVRRCAAYYGVKGLVDWIDAEGYRKVVVKVYGWGAHYYGQEMPADTAVSPMGDRVDLMFHCRTIWKTELLAEKRDKNGVRIQAR